jgi:hypothetical protein
MVNSISLDPESDSVSDNTGMPQNPVYGLIDFEIKAGHPGEETNVIIYLPEAIPGGGIFMSETVNIY